jgi:hypothetical protein
MHLLLIFVYRHNSILEVYSRAGLIGRGRISVVLLFHGEENIAYSQQTKPFLQDNFAHNRKGEAGFSALRTSRTLCGYC